MTESFKNVLHNESCLCQAVIAVMALDMGKEELSSLILYRPFLSLVDNYISFYQKKSQSSARVPIFYMLCANDEMRKLLAKYLTIRLGVFNGKTIQAIHKELAFNKAHGRKIPNS